MTQKHTLGPWHFQGISGNWWITSATPATPKHVGTHIARVFSSNPAMGFTDSPDYAESNANARLIAAAPELLAALQKIVANAPTDEPEAEDYDDTESAFNNGADCAAWDAAEIARAAIAKATGA